MSDNPFRQVNLLQSAILWLTVVILAASFVCALWINTGLRLPVEAADDTVGLLVDYDELKRIADGSPDISFADMARKAAVAGATGMVVRERILADWENAGDVLVFSGTELAFHLENEGGASGGPRSGAAVDVEQTYILTKDARVYEQIYSLLEAKRRYPDPFTYPGYLGIAAHLSSSERATLGLGFPLARLEEAAAEGLQIIPRLRNWEPVREDSLAAVFAWVANVPNLAGIGFNDQSVPGGGTNPVLQDYIAEAIAPLGKPLISFEFYDQAGLAGLAARLDYRVLRAHAIAENELRKYANLRDAMDRYNLAATERNIRYIYLRFYGLENPAASMMSNMELITSVRAGLVAEGLRIGDPSVIPSLAVPVPASFLTGAGVVAAGLWLLALGAQSFMKKRLATVWAALLVAGLAAWALLLLWSPVLAAKLMALAGAAVFPSLGILLALRRDRQPWGERLSPARLLRAVWLLLVLSAFTLAGAMVMSALLAAPAFMLKLDGFAGVKAAHLIPLVIVPFILWLRENDRYTLFADTVNSRIRFWQLMAGLVLLAGLALYILRTGNESLGTVSELEMQIRQYLDRILSVRPRTKEFLIGHPILLVQLYYGYRFSLFPLLLAGMIGQISLINTYAHIHTPLTISLLRSAHGLWIGIILGAAAIVVLTWIGRRTKAIGASHEYKERGRHDLS